MQLRCHTHSCMLWSSGSFAVPGVRLHAHRNVGCFSALDQSHHAVSAPPEHCTHDHLCRFELTEERAYRVKPAVIAGHSDYMCGRDQAMTEYLANEKVMNAINVIEGTPMQTYTLTVPDLRPLYTCDIHSQCLCMH